MITVGDIYDFLDSIAPFKNSAKFDNAGLIIGNREKLVKKVIIALDITDDVALESTKENANLIISHHPIIFKPLYKVDFNSTVSLLLKHEINAICTHTNLDSCPEGVNYHLAKALGLNSTTPFAFEDSNPYGILGFIHKEMDSLEFAKFVKKSLKCENLRYTANSDKIIKVAVCSGSGGDFVYDAIQNGADAFVTGEIKHNQILIANKYGLTVVDVGHFKSENIVMEPLMQILQNKFKSVEFKLSNTCTDKVKYL